MKPIVFDTVIDGKAYTFECGFDEIEYRYDHMWWACAYIGNTAIESSLSKKSEEDAILKLVKLLEK